MGNKGANVVTMTKTGLKAPAGFVVPVEAFKECKRSGKLPLMTGFHHGYPPLARPAGPRE